MDAPQRDKLKALALAATPQNIDSAEDATQPTGYIECPECAGEGSVELTADYCNYDGKAMGVQFYGVGPEHRAAEAFFRAANPATVLDLLADRDAMQMERDDLRAEVERLRAVLSALRDGIPLKEPVNISKAVLAQREARVSLSGGTGPVACAMLVNIQLTPWAEGPEKAEAFANGYNTAMKWYRAILLDLAKQVSAGAATRCRAEGGSTSDIGITTSAPAAGTVKDAERLDWLEQQIRAKGSVWLLPSGADMRFAQVRHAGHSSNYPTVSGTVREAIDAAITAGKENA